MTTRRALTTLATVFGLGATPLAAQPNCAPRTAVLDRLQGHFGETRQSIGLAGEGRVLEIFASDETGTWTIVVTLPNGVSCLVASGQAFEQVTDALPPEGTPS